MRIAVLDDYQGQAESMADWASLGAQVDFFSEPIPAEQLPARLSSYDALVLMRERTRFDAPTLAQLPQLAFVVSTGMRNASLDVVYLAQRGIPVSGTGNPGDERHSGVSSTVEVAWALIFALYKQVTSQDQALRTGRWQTALSAGLAGQTLGLLGLGRLGSEMVGPARAFGMEVIAWSEHLEPAAAQAKGVRYVSRDELFGQADVLSIHLVLSARSAGLVGASELAQMRSTAVIVNTSRGPIIDTAALIAALESGAIAGAGLDVFDREPLQADDRILQAPHTVLLPHLGYVTYEGIADMYRQAVEDLAAYVAGAPIRVIEP
jgi:phosphoglycerate dehydrogenase-like enzyme